MPVLFLCLSLFAASDTAEKVSAFLNQRDRLSAIQVLRTQIDKKGTKESTEEWQRLLQRVAEQFFTEKALSDYQLAESVFLRDPKRAQEIYKKVAELEPQNVLAVSGLVETLLVLDNCGEIRRHLQSVEDLYPTHPKIVLLKIQEKDCLSEEYSPLASTKGKSGTLLDYYEAKRRVAQGQLKSSQEWLTSTKGTFLDKLPEIWFLRWQVEPGAALRLSFASEYLQLCEKTADHAPKEFRSVREYCDQKSAMQKFIKGADSNDE